MPESPLTILQVSTTDDNVGGATRVAWNLFESYRLRGHRSRLAVGFKKGQDSDVISLSKSAGALKRIQRRLSRELGLEDFYFPGCRRLLTEPAQIIHGHNLHGGYFDLTLLPRVSCRVPVVLTLHDAWLLSGHCAHSFDCQRWKTGCGQCPYPEVYPGIRRDATHLNWVRKRKLYAKSRLNVATPCRWLMDKVNDSILAAAPGSRRVIPYGIDLSQFKTGDRLAARHQLGLPQDAKIVVFAANGVHHNPFKDYATMREAFERLVRQVRVQNLLFIALGENAPAQAIGQAEIRFIPYQMDPLMVASYFQACDIYLHGARADTFPNSILEAMACGAPVVASAVGGIPEQVMHEASAPAHAATGILVPPQDPDSMARALADLLENDSLRETLGRNAAVRARAEFDLNRQVEDYLNWYRQLILEFRES